MASSRRAAPPAPTLELAEAAAVAAWYRASMQGLPDDPGAQVTSIAGATAVALTAVDAAFFNRTIGLGSTRPATTADVAAIGAFYRGLGCRVWAVQVPDELLTDEPAAALAADGYRPSRRWMKLWRPLDALPEAPTSLRIERIGVEQAATFQAVELEGMGIPPATSPLARGVVGAPGWSTYLGFDGDEPVAAGAMYVAGDTAWLGFGCTVERARGRGGQSAILAARLRDARDLGCRLALTDTGEETPEAPVNPSYRNMLRLGFRVAYARPTWVHVDEPAAPAG